MLAVFRGHDTITYLPPAVGKEFTHDNGGTVAYEVDGKERYFARQSDFGWGQEFQRIGDILEEPDIIRGKLLKANAYLIDARALLAVGLMEMRSNPYAFVTDISKWI